MRSPDFSRYLARYCSNIIVTGLSGFDSGLGFQRTSMSREFLKSTRPTSRSGSGGRWNTTWWLPVRHVRDGARRGVGRPIGLQERNTIESDRCLERFGDEVDPSSLALPRPSVTRTPKTIASSKQRQRRHRSSPGGGTTTWLRSIGHGLNSPSIARAFSYRAWGAVWKLSRPSD